LSEIPIHLLWHKIILCRLVDFHCLAA
jgi:hypothetical protein